jgi:hypothetical protein
MLRALACVFSVLLAVSVATAASAPPRASPPRKAPAEPPPLAYSMLGVANGCFVETVAFLDRWHETKGSDAWARLLQWGAREEEEVVMGHAVAICEAKGALWSWDINHGWAKLEIPPAQREDPEQTAVPVLKQYPRVTARYPTYRFDFPQTPPAASPVAHGADLNRGIRDASLVGERLARRRPVNVVRFAYGGSTETEKRESAAVVFVFHGRYCVYVPELGTVPFRVRTGVENIRTIQELLRRMLPGVTGVRKL